jgi:hypothetical protein
MTQIIDLGKLRFSFLGEWSSAATYELNDVVRYGGNVYVYIYGLNTSGHLPTETDFWALMVQGIKFRGAYSAVTAYKVGDGVAHGGKVYIALLDTTGNTPPNATYWSQFADGVQYEGTYSPTTQYQRNDIVKHGPSSYIAKVDTLGNEPINTTYWDRLVSGVASQGSWATATEYYINDVVQHGGTTYICLARHTSGVFETDLTANQWVKFSTGFRFRGNWTATTSYLRDDVVKDPAGSAYLATQDHTSGASFSVDLAASKWTQLVVGGGDVLPVITSADIGQSLIVNAAGTGVDWIGATQSDKVYYVAPHGQDTVNNGKNLSMPFASIKYACQQAPTGSTIFVKTGTYSEQLPIVVPNTVAIVGDNQRTVIVQPAAGLSDDGVTPNNQSTMFLMSNGSILNKMTFVGMTGWVPGATPGNIESSVVKGVVAGLNPSSIVTSKSPYIIECAAIGSGLIGALVDGSVHASGAKSMLFHGYTVISDNGIGYWVKDGGKAEIVSCFTYYCYFGYASTGGGHIRALNGNSSYGTWGSVSQGYDVGESPVTGALIGQQLNLVYTGGNINAGDTVTAASGGTATVTNTQLTANKIYVKDATGTFTVGSSLTFTSGGTATISAGGLENQKGFVLVLNNLTAAPKPGQSLQLADDSVAYVVQSFTGTYVNAASEIVIVLAQEKPTGSASGAAVTLRSKYSQIRLTGHDFLSIGTGGVVTTNYPGIPTQPPVQGNETNEVFPGRVF